MIEGEKLTIIHGEGIVSTGNFWITQSEEAAVFPEDVWSGPFDEYSPADFDDCEVVYSIPGGTFASHFNLSPGADDGMNLYLGTGLDQ